MLSTHNFFLLTICNFLSEFRQNFVVSVKKLQLLALPIFWPTMPLFTGDCNLGLYTIVLSHYRTIIRRSTQNNWLQLVSKKNHSEKERVILMSLVVPSDAPDKVKVNWN